MLLKVIQLCVSNHCFVLLDWRIPVWHHLRTDSNNNQSTIVRGRGSKRRRADAKQVLCQNRYQQSRVDRSTIFICSVSIIGEDIDAILCDR
jgi:hypothetical protein